MRFKLTLFLVLLTMAVYFFFSNAQLYIKQDTLVSLSFYWNNFLPGLFTYEFAHIGLKHLFGNLVLLVLVGLICEQKLPVKDYLAIYFGSGAAGAIMFSYLNPGIALVGASACIAGLMVPAIIISPRRMVMGLILVALFSVVLMMPLLGWFSESLHMNAIKQVQQIEQEHENITAEKQFLFTQLIQLNKTEEQAKKQLEEGMITPEEYVMIKENISKQKNTTLTKVLEKQQEEKEVLQEKNKTLEIEKNLEQGISREKQMVTSVLVHAVGSMFGGIYLLVFKRDLLYETVSKWRVGERLARYL